MKARILLIEGKRADHPSFMPGLTRKGYQIETVSNGNEALQRLSEAQPNLVIIHAASMRTSGKRICQSIRQRSPQTPIVMIIDAEYADNYEKEDQANVVLALPFTLQKLINRIRPLLPVEKREVIQAGDLQLDTVHRWVKYGNRQSRLTPRLVVLLQALMEHPGEVVEREYLFRLVWDTEYTEDMRTLDVHISWLRQAIEEDARHPVLIKTVRGVGYRLDLDTAAEPQ